MARSTPSIVLRSRTATIASRASRNVVRTRPSASVIVVVSRDTPSNAAAPYAVVVRARRLCRADVLRRPHRDDAPELVERDLLVLPIGIDGLARDAEAVVVVRVRNGRREMEPVRHASAVRVDRRVVDVVEREPGR